MYPGVDDLLGVLVMGIAFLVVWRMTPIALIELGYLPARSDDPASQRSKAFPQRLLNILAAVTMITFFQAGAAVFALGSGSEYPVTRIASIAELALFIGWMVVLGRRARGLGPPR